MDEELRRRLADRAFLFDDPKAYVAGVEDALRAVDQTDAADPEDLTDQRPAARILP